MKRNERVAAFFDLDGTLIGEPALERRYFSDLRKRGAIPSANYLRWLSRAVRLAPRGLPMMRHANKMYLRGLCGDDTDGCGGQPGIALPHFFPEGVKQVAWHARQGHAIVLVSGTLAPLAQEMALALVVRLAVRGVTASVAACATRLEEKDGRWTGNVVGEAMFGEAKGRAVHGLARDQGFALDRCYAYGDCLSDRWMLEAVGRPCVVNPSEELGRLARRRDWAVLVWRERDDSERSRRAEQPDEMLTDPGTRA